MLPGRFVFRTLAVAVAAVAATAGGVTPAFAPRSAHAGVFPAGYRLSLDAGYNTLDYSEDHAYQPSLSTPAFSQRSVMVGAELLYYIVTHLNADLGRYQGDLAFLGSVSYSGLPIDSTISGTSAQVLRLDLRLGWVVPFLAPPFTLNLMAGFYQTNMFVTNDAFGYTKLTGPELYPTLHYTRWSENAVPTVYSVFFKYSPVTDGSTPFDFGNREIGFGASMRFPLRDQFEWLKQGYERAFTVKAFYADLEHTFQINRSVAVRSKSLSLTLGLDI